MYLVDWLMSLADFVPNAGTSTLETFCGKRCSPAVEAICLA